MRGGGPMQHLSLCPATGYGRDIHSATEGKREKRRRKNLASLV